MRRTRFGTTSFDFTDIITENLPYVTDEEKKYVDSIPNKVWGTINGKIVEEAELHIRENLEKVIDNIIS